MSFIPGIKLAFNSININLCHSVLSSLYIYPKTLQLQVKILANITLKDFMISKQLLIQLLIHQVADRAFGMEGAYMLKAEPNQNSHSQNESA